MHHSPPRKTILVLVRSSDKLCIGDWQQKSVSVIENIFVRCNFVKFGY
jgi:hypothetical protein